MKRSFRVFALLTIFTLVLNTLSILILIIPAKAGPTNGDGTGSDTMSSMTVGANSSHVISYYFLTAPVASDTFTITFPVPGFVCTGLTTDNVTASTGWTPTSADENTCEIVLTASAFRTNPIVVTIAETNMINPDTVESYAISLSGSDETKTLQVAIVDSDIVNITGYVASNLFFDIDTGYDEADSWYNPAVDCGFDTCYDYSGDGSTPQSNYTVDLGNLTMMDVNKSGLSSTHLNGEGIINSIYFDISSNSAGGVVITYKSQNGELRGPGHNIDSDFDMDIPTTNGSDPIIIGTSGYGIQLAADPGAKSFGAGTQSINCGHADPVLEDNTYCVMGIIDDMTGENVQTPQPIYTTSGPIELGRGKIDVAAAIDGTVIPGNYEDYITFIATSIF